MTRLRVFGLLTALLCASSLAACDAGPGPDGTDGGTTPADGGSTDIPRTFALTITVNGSGTTDPAPGTHTYAAGTSVRVAARPSNGATFAGWSGSATGTANPVTILVDGDETLTANFSSGGGVTPGTTGLAIGADVSEVLYAQDKGVQYHDTDGTRGDGMQILRNHGYTWARIRVNVDPASTDYALFTDLAYAKTSALEAKRMGFKVLIDFHYSHWWADPANQWTPTTWSNPNSISALESMVYDWTYSAMGTLIAAGVTPDMVQIGNEITNGLLWDLGGPYRSGGSWGNMAALVNQGIRAVKARSTATKIMLHLHSGGSWATTSDWITKFIASSGDWGSVDAMGFSYYPMWQGSFSDLREVLSGMKSSYGSKHVWIAETAWYWTTSAAGNSSSTYPSTPDGQYQFLRDLVDVLDDYSNVKGAFYWGAGWCCISKWLVAPGWSNDDPSTRALFDSSGVATKGIDGL